MGKPWPKDNCHTLLLSIVTVGYYSSNEVPEITLCLFEVFLLLRNTSLHFYRLGPWFCKIREGPWPFWEGLPQWFCGSSMSGFLDRIKLVIQCGFYLSHCSLSSWWSWAPSFTSATQLTPWCGDRSIITHECHGYQVMVCCWPDIE